jgi:DNA repair exonuclease SbcCD ATPase subunit
MSRIVHVTGENLDAQGDDGRAANNGVGKSSVADVVSYALTGKTIKTLSQEETINHKEGKRLYAEVRVDDYRIVRTRKPDSLKVWHSPEGVWTDETEVTKGGMPATQKYIDEVLGLSQDALAALIFFKDDNRDCFLECSKADKREIVENMLGLEKYREYCENAKKRKKLVQARIKTLTKEYELSTESLASAKVRLKRSEDQEAAWKSKLTAEFKAVVAALKDKQAALVSSDAGSALAEYENAQEEIADLNEMMTEKEQKKQTLSDVVSKEKGKLDAARDAKQKVAQDVSPHLTAMKEATATIASCRKTIDDVNKKVTAANCPMCLGAVKEENFKNVLLKAKNEIDSAESIVRREKDILKKSDDEVSKLGVQIANLVQSIEENNNDLSVLTADIGRIRTRLGELMRIKEPKVGSEQLLLQSQIEELTRQAHEKQAERSGPSPYASNIELEKKEIESKQLEVDLKKQIVAKAEEDLPYFDYFVKAFGDNGIRRFVVRDILPALNSRTAYWLQYTMNNQITVKFDDELDATIERNPPTGRSFVYNGLSRGIQRRTNLGVQQGFAYVRMLTCGFSPSFIFLDEVSSNVDQAGIVCVYNFICELAKDKQVFVTTHSSELAQMLDGCDRIYLQMKDGITRQVHK